MSKVNVLAGFLAGAIAGVVAGLLIAPDKGSETAEKLKSTMKDVSQSVVDTFESQKEYLEGQLNKFKKDVHVGKEEVQRAAAKAVEEVKTAARKVGNTNL
ncbi:MAG TPA: YtxH domain-containing protein [Bacteroidales bacterium]|nr:YtxH domain-containing protein [Bacteroidales bacterium]